MTGIPAACNLSTIGFGGMPIAQTNLESAVNKCCEFGLRWYEQLCLFLNDDINQFAELAFGIVVLQVTRQA